MSVALLSNIIVKNKLYVIVFCSDCFKYLLSKVTCWVLGRWRGYGVKQGTDEQVTWTWWCWCRLYRPAVTKFTSLQLVWLDSSFHFWFVYKTTFPCSDDVAFLEVGLTLFLSQLGYITSGRTVNTKNIYLWRTIHKIISLQ
jgi:hypothetical protein